MKIAVIGAKGLPAKQGGIEHYCQELYPRMVKRGHSVDLFARSSYIDSPWLHCYDYRGVRVISLPCSNLKGIDALSSSILGAILASNDRYDLIHFHAEGPSLFSWLPKIVSSSTVVVSCQGLDWQRAKWGKLSSQLLYLGEKTGVRFADEIIVVSEELRSYFREVYDRETVYIPNAPASYVRTSCDRTYSNSLGLSRGRYIIFVGRLVPEKRPELAIEAFKSLQPHGWKLVLIGGTSDTDSYTQQLINSTKGHPNIIFTGELSGDRLAEIVRGAGLFVLPSDVEGLPLAMLEAMQEGIPVLASDIPPHKQLLSGGRGTLFPAGDLDSFIFALNWAIHRPQELAIMAKGARRYVKANYNWENITTETLRSYQTALSSRRIARQNPFRKPREVKEF
jgi:glycosyltransferase involved in cell wall biosynthesis